YKIVDFCWRPYGLRASPGTPSQPVLTGQKLLALLWPPDPRALPFPARPDRPKTAGALVASRQPCTPPSQPVPRVRNCGRPCGLRAALLPLPRRLPRPPQMRRPQPPRLPDAVVDQPPKDG